MRPSRRAASSRSCARVRRAELALPRAGDWFGRPVNLASRITAVARPGSLLVERTASRGGARELPLQLRRAAPAEGDPRARLAVQGAPAGGLAASSPTNCSRDIAPRLPPRDRPDAARRPPRPEAPGGAPRGPLLPQRQGVLVGVHAAPEAPVAVSVQLAPAASRCSGSRSSTLSSPRRSSAERSKQKKPPLIQCSERGFSSKREHAPVGVELGRRRTAAAGARRSRWRAPPWRAWKASSAARSRSASPSE